MTNLSPSDGESVVGRAAQWVRVGDLGPTRRIYRLNPAGVTALKDQLDTFWRRALDGYQNVIEDKTEGPGWESVRDGVGHDQGRPLYLDRYAALFGDD
ncbi:hypothetical protein Adu01nite_05080 [Paractinoplanes durhamensis]|uniref:Uncharacterized protein n=1 Tax=Paractinoplanes durhamensis TaxID=113563 RepID=A0ABQ3YNM3_9ACTN|nr:hypothetical protein Adu01nite_05080 [Actinoplanes durhamensis]